MIKTAHECASVSSSVFSLCCLDLVCAWLLLFICGQRLVIHTPKTSLTIIRDVKCHFVLPPRIYLVKCVL